MSDFQIESWELPPDVKRSLAIGPIHFDVNCPPDQKRQVIARVVRLSPRELRIVFRFQSEANINYFVMSQGALTAPESFSPSLNNTKVERVVRMALKNQQFSYGRVFYCEDELWLYPNSTFCWKPHHVFRCEFALPAPMREAPSQSVFDWLRYEWNQLDSETRFSWEWNRLDAEQRHTFLCERVPRWRELHDLMQSIARYIELPEASVWILDHVDTYNHSSDLLDRLAPWRSFMLEYFPPFEPFPDSAPDCLRSYFQMVSNHIAVRGEDTTQHERLEAHLHLRHWLRQNAPDRMDLLPE